MRTRWLPFNPPQSRASLQLYCLPYAGGGASIFRSWQEAMPDAVEVCPVELPGRGTRHRETPFTCLGALVPVLAEAIAPLLDGPFAFYGHSVGALIAFELARHLRRWEKRLPVLLVAAAHRSPSLPCPPVPTGTRSRGLVEHLKFYGGTPPEVLQESELVGWKAEVLDADVRLSRGYVYYSEPPLECPILVFGGFGDRLVRSDEIDGWRAETSAGFQRRNLPGDHFFLRTAEPLLVRLIAHQLRSLGAASIVMEKAS